MSIQTKKQRAVTLFQQRQIESSRRLFEQVCRRDKYDLEAWIYLGITQFMLGDTRSAEEALRYAVKLQPSHSLAHFNLGCALEANKKYRESAEEFHRATMITPDNYQAWHNLGGVLRILGQTSQAVRSFLKALRINPASAESYRGLASTYLTQGKAKDAAAACNKVLDIMPDNRVAHSLLLFLSTLYLDDPRQIYDMHLEWARRHIVPKTTGWWECGKKLNANGPIRIGYLSPNFYQHSVAYFFEPLIKNHDPANFQIYCYSDVENEDAVTERIKEYATVWRATVGMNDNELVRIISNDRIHILIDLAGHTTRNRLMVMMQKPAPIQMQYIGYLCSTGIDRIDYWMTDAWTDPLGLSDETSAETIIRLPRGYLCYQPNPQAPDVSRAPWEKNGYITFGSFNHVSKISDAAFDLWAEVLITNPDTHLVLKNESFLDESTRREWLDRFREKGVDESRIQLLGITESVVEHLALYSLVDIGLDTIPYNGTTTTCEALWQGVPVITLPGQTHCGRQGLSLLSQVGLTDFVAGSRSGFIEIATRYVHEPRKITELRSQLRNRMQVSPLCDGEALAADVEAAYLAALERWDNNATLNYKTIDF